MPVADLPPEKFRRAVEGIVDDNEAPAAAVRIFLKLVLRHGPALLEGGRVALPVRATAKVLKISPGAAERGLRWLCARGWLVAAERHKGTTQRVPNVYTAGEFMREL